jgi:DNA polymerase III subunit delta
MAVVKSQGFDAFLRRDLDRISAILVFGSDEGGVRDRAMQAVKQVAGSLDDPFHVARLDDQMLAADPGRLADEVNAMSLMGGRRVVWVENAGSAFLKAVEPLAGGKPGNIIIAEAGNLAKSAKLRVLFENAESFAAVACYEDEGEGLSRLVDQVLGENRLTIDDDARDALVELLGADRMLSRRELEKLALYCHGQPRVTLADVEACVGDTSGLSSDDLLAAAFGGELAETDRLFARLRDQGTMGQQLAILAMSHMGRLSRLRVDVDRGKSVETAVKTARPPIFFKQQAALMRELALWDSESLDEAGRLLNQAIIDTRTTALSDLTEQIVHRAFLSLARLALQRRRTR